MPGVRSGPATDRDFNGFAIRSGSRLRRIAPRPNGSAATLDLEQAAAIDRIRTLARRTSDDAPSRDCSAESRRSSASTCRRRSSAGRHRRATGELLLGSSAEPFSRLVGPEVFSIVAGTGGPRGLRRAAERTTSVVGPPRRCSPASSMRTRSHWAAVESVLGVPFYSPRDGSTTPRERLALRLQLARAAGPWWALDGLAIVSERPLTRLARCRWPAACRARTGARVR